MTEYFRTKGPEKKEVQKNSDADKMLSILNTLVDQNNSTGMLYRAGESCLLSDIIGQKNLQARFEFNNCMGVTLIKIFISLKISFNVAGSEQNTNKDRFRVGYNQQNSFNNDGKSEDGDTNKAIRYRVEQVEFNSEGKDSMNDRSKNGRQAEFEKAEAAIYKFEDLLAPVLDIVGQSLKRFTLPSLKDDKNITDEIVMAMSDNHQAHDSLETQEIVKSQEIVDLVRMLSDKQPLLVNTDKHWNKNQPKNLSSIVEENIILKKATIESDDMHKQKEEKAGSDFTLSKLPTPPPEAKKQPGVPKKTFKVLAKNARTISKMTKNILKSQAQDPLSWAKARETSKDKKMTGDLEKAKTIDQTSSSSFKKGASKYSVSNIVPNLSNYYNITKIVTYFSVDWSDHRKETSSSREASFSSRMAPSPRLLRSLLRPPKK